MSKFMRRVALAAALVCVSISGSAAYSAVSAIKWHPGQYVWITPQTFSTENLSSITAQVSSICQNANIKGVHLAIAWASLEGPARGDYSKGFAAIDKILNQVSRCSKTLMLGVKTMGYSGKPRTENPTASSEEWLYPRYLLQGREFGGTQAPYGVAYSAPGVSWDGGLSIAGMIWTQPVMDRMIALSAAYARRLDQHPNFEMLSADETSLSVIGFGYSHGALTIQLKRRMASDAINWPHTMVRILANWSGSHAQMLDLFNECLKARNCAVGGPDPELPLPKISRTIAANELFRGQIFNTKTQTWGPGGTDFRGRLAWIAAVQDFGLNKRIITTPVALLQNYAEDVMHSSHMIWIRGGRWNEVLAQINADPVLYTMACPSSFFACTCN